MKRDMGLCREILRRIEALEGSPARPLKIEGHSEKEVGYHVYLLHDAGLIKATDIGAQDVSTPNWWPLHLTWKGHEYLDQHRGDNSMLLPDQPRADETENPPKSPTT